MRKLLTTIIFSTTLILGMNTSFGHGGGLDSQGGHNCRVGSCAGTYHCHQARGPACGGGAAVTLPRKTITPKCLVESDESLSRENVAFLQSRLKNLGFNPGAIDGNYGGSSKRALNAYEKKFKLKISSSGSINNESLKKLDVNC